MRTRHEDAERFAQLDRGRAHARGACDGTGSSAARAPSRYRMSVPGGGAVRPRGVTVVGVLPTHRRRGVLTAMMKAQLDDCRARGASSSHTSGHRRRRSTAASATGSPRSMGAIDAARASARASRSRSSRAARCGCVELDEAARSCSRRSTTRCARSAPGCSRAARRGGRRASSSTIPRAVSGGPLNRALLELDGKPAGYALYRVKQDWHAGVSSKAW